MPTPYGAEFRPDVIEVARKGEAPLAQENEILRRATAYLIRDINPK